jgi:hypothetical protein
MQQKPVWPWQNELQAGSGQCRAVRAEQLAMSEGIGEVPPKHGISKRDWVT